MRNNLLVRWGAITLFLVLLVSGPYQNSLAQDRPAPAALVAKDILGNPDYLAFSYGGYREATRDDVPTVDQLKEDMKILSAMGVKLLRTYNTQQYGHAANLLEAIRQLRKQDSGFEMYVMLGAWIECEGAWTTAANHEAENIENNLAEIDAAIKLTKAYPETVKIIAVGNEAMVHWATSYFVRPAVIHKWVDHLQGLKVSGDLPANIWITSSDNFASWGGGDASYRTEELKALIESVDFVSLHTYPFHDTYYSPEFWVAPEEEESLSVVARADAAMQRAKAYAVAQYQETADYIESLGIKKPIHIGETGWASTASSSYGATGSQAADQYKAKLYYEAMRDWTNKAGMSCFYFEAFDEQWKDAENAGGSENHFGLINLKGQAKYALWDQVDAGIFEGLTRTGFPITKTYGGDEAALLASVLKVPAQGEVGSLAISTVNQQRAAGEVVTEGSYVVAHQSLVPDPSNDMTYPSDPLKLNVWEGTCAMEMSSDGVIHVSTGTGQWWGCALEIQAGGKGENLSQFKSGRMRFEIKGETKSSFNIGFQTGLFTAGTQVNNALTFGPEQKYQLSGQWRSYSISLRELDKGANLADVTGIMFLRGDHGVDGKSIDIRNVYFTQE
jgi:exo-beta-1,3-glucanase (GH17 family)